MNVDLQKSTVVEGEAEGLERVRFVHLHLLLAWVVEAGVFGRVTLVEEWIQLELDLPHHLLGSSCREMVGE